MVVSWTYPHQDLGEPPLPDGSPVLRPVVPLEVTPGAASVRGVIDSGSPLCVADSRIFGLVGVDIEVDEPLFEVPVSVGGRFSPVPVFDVELWVRPPESEGEPVAWRLPLGARRSWRLPFAVLLGQHGWFDRFPTRIDAESSTVEV